MRVAVVPGALALLPRYAGQVDPLPELRAACLAAVAWLGEAPEILGDPQGVRVGESLVESVGLDTPSLVPRDGYSTNDSAVGRVASASERIETPGSAYLVVANGSARRTQASPGPYDERAVGFDAALGRALKDADAAALAAIDQDLARELWAATTVLPELAGLLTRSESVTVDYDDAPFGVSYWVVRYENADR